jgi:methylenetetrahydrofolate reductase (NADPH)
MDRVHSFWFDNGPGARLQKKMFSGIQRYSPADQRLEKLERAIKSPLFGCETCGMCRLAATQYICPETCPKGLANGPCGGTSLNTCEFGDRECIHNHKYRVARDTNNLAQLESCLIPAIPETIRHTSSWPPHFRGEGLTIDLNEDHTIQSDNTDK